MAVTTFPLVADVPEPSGLVRLRQAFGDGMAVAGRNLRAMSRTPEVLVFGSIQPVVMILTFRYVFSGNLRAPGVDYVDFLMPGIWVQAAVFGTMNTAVGLAEDMRRGLIERFRSLPMARSAVLVGRTVADLGRNITVVALMVVVGFAVGFRAGADPLRFLAALLMLLAFAFAVSWVFATVAMSVRNVEAVSSAVFPPCRCWCSAPRRSCRWSPCRRGSRAGRPTSRSPRRSTRSGRWPSAAPPAARC